MLRTRPTIGQVSWITILVLIGLVQVIRAQPFDALFFAGAVAVTTLDATGIITAPSEPRRLSVRVLFIGGVLAATFLSMLPRHGAAMVVCMLLIAAAVFIAVWPGSGVRPPWSRGIRTLAWSWGIIMVVGCLWELFAFILSLVAPQAPAPALSDLLNPLLADRLGQVVFAALWVALGAWLVRRVGQR